MRCHFSFAVRGTIMEIDLEMVAKRVVKDALRLREGDSLGVHTYEHSLPLAKEIVKAARRAGADTILTTDSDDVWYEALLKLPVDWLKERSSLLQAVLRATTALVSLDGPEDPSRMRDIAAERWRANEQGATATWKPFEERGVRSVSLEISRVTEARARAYGFDYGEWHGSTLKAMTVDPKTLRERGNCVIKSLKGVRRGRLTAPGGTDLRFEFHGASPTLWTGEVRPVKGRKSTYHGSLPSGMVGIALRQGSGEGRVVSTTPIAQFGEFIKGLRWTFDGGRMTKVDAKEHLDFFNALWVESKRKKGADQLGSLSIGLNPEARFGFLNNEIVEGCITLAIGDNEHLGGTNRCQYSFPVSFKDANLEVNGRRIVVGGRLKV